jgi:hypothetical protein
MLGGNGILLDFHVIRHMADIEAIHSFEGTETIQSLIVGRDITGVGAVHLSGESRAERAPPGRMMRPGRTHDLVAARGGDEVGAACLRSRRGATRRAAPPPRRCGFRPGRAA